MLRYTGHPFIDVGVAVIVAFAEVDTPQEVTEAHIEDFVAYALEIYEKRSMLGYLQGVIFPNIINPGVTSNEKLRPNVRIFLEQIFNVRHWKPEDGPLSFMYSEPVAAFADDICTFSGDIAALRIPQAFMPMIGGGSTINFFPEGNPRLPISAWCFLAMLAMPFATLNTSGKAFLVHSHDAGLLQELTRLNFERNRQAFQMESIEKRPNYKFPKTRLIQDLLNLERFQRGNVPLTGYRFTSAPRSAQIEIYHLPSNIVRFISLASKLYPKAWNEVVARAWEMQKDTNKDEEESGVITYNERNFFYEDLFDLPQNAVGFLRQYLLRYKRAGKVSKTDPRFEYSFIREREVISWELIGLFLERVMNMDKSRLEAIKRMGDRLAEYMQKVDPRFYKKLYMARNDYQMRRELQIAANAAKGSYHETLLPYDEFIQVFFIDDGDTAQPDWYLARDLLMIRIIEQLSNDWIEAHKDDIDVEKEADSNMQKGA